MLDLTITFSAARRPDEVFAFVADSFFVNHPRWDPAIVELRKTSGGAVAVGTRGVEVRRFLGRQSAEFEVTAFERPSTFAFRNTDGPFALERSYSFSEADGGTLVQFVFRMSPRQAAVRPVWPLLRRVIARQVRANIRRLEQLLQAESPAGPLDRDGAATRTLPRP